MEKTNLDQFIKYWNGVICRWLDNYNDIEEKQRLFFDLKNRKDVDVLKLCQDHMPEPYWGNPQDCSIVIANYNPGGGADNNKHTHREGTAMEKTFISEVLKKKSYSQVALDFPIINKSENEDCWWEDYGGSNWWLSKKKWLEEYIIPAFKNAENIKKKKPFAIEFCGWHSVSWPSRACTRIYKNEVLKPVIDKYFIDVLTDAVKQSESEFGVCVGAQFYHMFISKGMRPVKCYKNTGSPKYDLHLFEINGARILSIWGAGYNRYPKIDSEKLKKLLER